MPRNERVASVTLLLLVMSTSSSPLALLSSLALYSHPMTLATVSEPPCAYLELGKGQVEGSEWNSTLPTICSITRTGSMPRNIRNTSDVFSSGGGVKNIGSVSVGSVFLTRVVCPRCCAMFGVAMKASQIICAHCGEVLTRQMEKRKELCVLEHKMSNARRMGIHAHGEHEKREIERRFFDALAPFDEQLKMEESALEYLLSVVPTRAHKLFIPKIRRVPTSISGNCGYAAAFKALGLLLNKSETNSRHWHCWYADPKVIFWNELQNAIRRRLHAVSSASENFPLSNRTSISTASTPVMVRNQNLPFKCPDCTRPNPAYYAKGRCQACYRRNINRPQRQLKRSQPNFDSTAALEAASILQPTDLMN